METQQNPPSKIARLADSRTGLATSGCWNAMERNGSNNGNRGCVSPTPIGLELGLELGSGTGPDTAQRQISSGGCAKYPSGFTILQLQELQLQSLIYNYIEAGLPVPYHLVLPIWKSVASSVGGLNASFNQLCPSFTGYSAMYLEYTNGMDPEPGRCRRTDGKKWRCSKETLPDQKYCERHMHRGRQRSRKLVEGAASQTPTTSTNLSISLPGTSSSTANSNSSFSPKSVLRGDHPHKKY